MRGQLLYYQREIVVDRVAIANEEHSEILMGLSGLAVRLQPRIRVRHHQDKQDWQP